MHAAGIAEIAGPLEASTRASCVASGLSLIPPDEVRAAIHFRTAGAELEDAAAIDVAGQLRLRALVLVDVRAGFDPASVLLRVRIVQAGSVHVNFAEAPREEAGERVAAFIRAAFVTPLASPASSTSAAAPAPSIPVEDPPPSATGPRLRVSVEADEAAALVIRIARPDGSSLRSDAPSGGLTVDGEPGRMLVTVPTMPGLHAVCVGLAAPTAAATALRGEVSWGRVSRSFRSTTTAVAQPGSCGGTARDFATAFRVPGEPPPADPAPASGPSAAEVSAPDGVSRTLENRGSARICRATAGRGEEETELLEGDAVIEPRATVALRVPAGSERLTLESCRGQRLGWLSLDGDDDSDDSTLSADYTELGNFPVFLRLALGFYTLNVWVPQYSAVGYGLWPAATLTLGYALEPGGIGIGLLVRAGAIFAGGAGTCCSTAFGGMALAGLSTPSGLLGVGVALQNDAAAIALGVETQQVRFTNDFYGAGSAQIGLSVAGSLTIVYGLGISLGGSIL